MGTVVQYKYPIILPFTCRISRRERLSPGARRAASGIFLWVDQECKYDPSKDGKPLLNKLIYYFTVGFAVVFEIIVVGICFSVSMVVGNFECFVLALARHI